MGEVDDSAGRTLRPEDAETYRSVAAGEQATDPKSARRLAELGLIDQDPYAPDRYLARDPHGVARESLAQVAGTLAAAVTTLRQIPVIEEFGTQFQPHRWYGGPGSEFLATQALMNARIEPLANHATTELFTAQPGEPADRDPEVLRVGVEHTAAIRRRGVRVRTIYTSRAVDHEQTAAHVDLLVDAGVEVRVYARPFPRMVVVDQRHLFIDNLVVPEAAPHAGWHVSDRSAVAWGRSIFGMLWDRSTPWQQLPRATADAASTARQRAILRELESGYSQTQVGQHFGLSERTIGVALADLRDRLGMATLYQLLVWWGRTKERDLP
ncbi:LuxR C-terminal-related transcriptional regulator [Streptomyces sp. NPDC008125]|uniref:LuxR C-terminal-related transcriptional regulator n=1 Tax=Streptomyces sp. NPDC008125 TaxID=3364811 RepID=UPI0036E1FFDD